jgi:hypothetical protein
VGQDVILSHKELHFFRQMKTAVTNDRYIYDTEHRLLAAEPKLPKFIPNIKPDSIWVKYELPTLTLNPNVSRVVTHPVWQ